MGFLNQSFDQVRDLFASMTPAARITAGLLLAVIGVSLTYLFQGYHGAADEYLFAGEFLAPRDADRVEAAIATAGLAGYERDGGRIRVPRGKKAAYLAAVADAGALPANFNQVMEDSLNLGPFVSGDERRQRAKASRERQLSMIVSMMNGVEDAKVLFDVREARGFGKDNVTATVSVLPRAGETLDARRMRLIRGAVAGAIAGLKPVDVTILNLADGTQYDQAGRIDAANFNEPYFQTRVAYEQFLKGNIEDFLEYIPGIKVQVSAELDETLASRIRTTKTDSDPVAVSESTQTESSTNIQTEDRGRPGLAAQGPNRQPAEEALAKNESKIENSDSKTENFIPFSEEQLQRSGLVPKHVRAAIAIPSAYLDRVWRETNKGAAADAKPTSDELERMKTNVAESVRTTVTSLFPKEPGENPYPNVQVTFLQSLTPDPVQPEPMLSGLLAWASQNSGSLIMAGLAGAALLLLRSMVKAIPSPATNIVLAPRLAAQTVTGGNAGQAPASGQAAVSGDGATRGGGETMPSGGRPAPRNRPRLKLRKGASLKDDLTDLVREDPDSAAAILKSWIGNAG